MLDKVALGAVSCRLPLPGLIPATAPQPVVILSSTVHDLDMEEQLSSSTHIVASRDSH
jgi:hypothetical protein